MLVAGMGEGVFEMGEEMGWTYHCLKLGAWTTVFEAGEEAACCGTAEWK